jgi:hypothetical protein
MKGGFQTSHVLDTAKISGELKEEKLYSEEQARVQAATLKESLQSLRGLAEELDATDWMFVDDGA